MYILVLPGLINACIFYEQTVTAGIGTDTDTRTINLFFQMFAFQWGKEPFTSFF